MIFRTLSALSNFLAPTIISYLSLHLSALALLGILVRQEEPKILDNCILHLNSIRKKNCKSPTPLTKPIPLKYIKLDINTWFLFIIIIFWIPKTNVTLKASMIRNVERKLNDLKKKIFSKVVVGRIIVVTIETFRQIYCTSEVAWI